MPIRLLSRQRLSIQVLAIGGFVAATVFSSAQELTPEQRAQLDKIVNVQRNFDAGRLNSEGTHVRAKELSRTENGGIVASYALYATGFTARLYDLVTIPITPQVQTVDAGADLQLAEDGQLMDGPNDPRVLIVPDFVPGEPLRLGLLSKDGKQRAFVTILPNPIKDIDHGCSLNVIRLLPRFEIALVEATGFPPNAELDFKSDSFGEIHNGKLKTDAAGQVQTAILPFVKGESKGAIRVAIEAPSCKPHVSFKWGTTSE